MSCLNLAPAAANWIAIGQWDTAMFGALGLVASAFIAWVPMVRTIVMFDRGRARV